MGKILKLLFSRATVIGLLIAAQAAIFIGILAFAAERIAFIYNIFMIINIVFVIKMFSNEQAYEYKLLWSLVIILFPPLGGVFYLLWGKRSTDWKALRSLKIIYNETRPLLKQDETTLINLKTKKKHLGKNAYYLNNVANAPVYDNCKATYLKNGQVKFQHLIEELNKAEKFICMEYFIISPGVMFDTILDILKRKAKEGVEVYFMYDDAGSVARVDRKYFLELQKYGIKAVCFNRLRPRMYTLMNYRDHRKITVIDGKVGFVGGINLADEYINEIQVHGYWKDTAVMIEGNAVWNLTVMFFQLWSFASGKKVDYLKYKTDNDIISDGYVQPFGDDPLDGINVAETNYFNIINNAHDYVYITTPYLIIDSEMIMTLCTAARSGVDVRIVTPGIPDKKSVFYVTQSYYKVLLESGVRIYEYTPGFIHAKMFVSDDDVAVVGTINLDYRSLYLHFECGSVFYKSNIALDVKKDIEHILDASKEITLKSVKQTFILKRILQALLRIFAPLL